jgi:hypothetical protein
VCYGQCTCELAIMISISCLNQLRAKEKKLNLPANKAEFLKEVQQHVAWKIDSTPLGGLCPVHMQLPSERTNEEKGGSSGAKGVAHWKEFLIRSPKLEWVWANIKNFVYYYRCPICANWGDKELIGDVYRLNYEQRFKSQWATKVIFPYTFYPALDKSLAQTRLIDDSPDLPPIRPGLSFHPRYVPDRYKSGK